MRISKVINLGLFLIICLFVFQGEFVRAEESRFGARGLAGIPVDRLDEGCELAVQTDLGWWHNEFSWASIEPTKPIREVHNYSWDKKDAKIKASLDHNTGVVALTLCDSTWGSNLKAGCEGGIPLPEHESDFQEFIRNVVERYDGDGIDDAPFITAQKNIKYWVVENEPGNDDNWCAPMCGESLPSEEYSQCIAQQYAAHFQMTLESIKSADETAIVAPAGIGTYAILEMGIFAYMLETMQQSGTDLDFVVFHNYLDPETIPVAYNTIQDNLLTYGFGSKPVWLTETNFGNGIIEEKFGTSDPHDINKEEFDVFVAGHLIKRYAYAFSAGTRKVSMYKFMDDIPWPGDTATEHWGMVDTLLNPKLLYFSHQTMTSKLRGFSDAKQITSPGYYLFRFDFENNRSMFIAWSDNLINANLGLGRVKVTDIYGNETIQESSSLSLTDLPIFIERVVTLISPNGGEIIPAGGTYAIRWEAPSNAVKFDLMYSMNGTELTPTWRQIAKGIIDTSYNWTVAIPLNSKTKCLVKAIGYDASGVKVGEGISDSTFTIEVVKVTSPDTGDALESGKQWTITWKTYMTARPVAKAYLYYTKDGINWKPIGTCEGDPGWFRWIVPRVLTEKPNCKVKVNLKDAKGNTVGKDISDGFFTIHPSL